MSCAHAHVRNGLAHMVVLAASETIIIAITYLDDANDSSLPFAGTFGVGHVRGNQHTRVAASHIPDKWRKSRTVS